MGQMRWLNISNRWRAGKSWETFIIVLFLFFTFKAYGQSALQIDSFGSDIGGTLLTTSFSNPVSSQYQFFVRHDLNETLIGELQLGLGFLSNPLQRSRLYSLDYQLLFPFGLFSGQGADFDDAFTPYLYAGLGVARYQRLNVQVQNDPLLRKSAGKIPNTTIWNNGTGWVARIPIGVGADYRLDDMTALKLNVGYHLLAGQAVMASGSKVEGFLAATVGLRFRPFDRDRDHDRLPNANEIYHAQTSPDNPDTDGDGLEDGEELYFTKTDPLNKDTDGDGLTDGEEVQVYHTNPLLADTDGGLMSDGAEVKRSSNPHDRSDDYPVAAIPSTKIPANKVLAYRTFALFHYGTLKYQWRHANERSLLKAIQLMRLDSNLKLKIAGYADERGDSVMNCSLSDARSWNIQKFFLEQHINPNRIYSIGNGEVDNDTTSYTANRRTEIRLAYRIPQTKEAVGDEDLPAIQIDETNLIPQDAIQFSAYSDQLTDSAKRWLKALAEYLSGNKYKVQIIGTTDGSGSKSVNEMLREARAASVARFLVNTGVSIDRLRIDHNKITDEAYRGVLIRRVKQN